MLDEQYPFGLNMFAVGKLDSDNKRTQAVDRIMHIFDVLWPDVLSQANLPRYVRPATIALLSNPGRTLVDMRQFLSIKDGTLRVEMLANVRQEDVREFWREDYDELTDVEKTRRVGPLLNRLDQLFLGRSLISNILGQRETSISFRQVIDHRQVIFVRLPVNEAEQDSRLIGTLLMAQIAGAIFSYRDTPDDQRPGVSLYVDEFQNFTTPDFEKLYREGRKYGACITLAHQGRSQLPKYLQDATESAYTKVVFNVIPGDASELSQSFKTPDERVDMTQLDHKVCERLLTHGSDYPSEVRDFVTQYLAPLEPLRHGGKIKMVSRLNRPILDFGQKALVGGSTVPDFEEPDPIDALNRLLYEVMSHHTTALAIPYDAAIGFSGLGHGFHGALKLWHRDWLNPGVQFPRHLVVNGRWIGRASSAGDRLLHFVFCLRQMMAYLAEHPIGKMTKGNSDAIASMLTALPVRIAFVRSGDDQGTIRTFDSPSGVQGLELNQRLRHIQRQTRETYCHPREEVEGRLRDKPAVQWMGSVPIEHFEEVDRDATIRITRVPRDPAQRRRPQ
jgi:hypothetical protein